MKRKEMTNFICEEILKVYTNIRHEETLKCAVRRGLKKAHRVDIEKAKIRKAKRRGLSKQNSISTTVTRDANTLLMRQKEAERTKVG